MTRFYQVGGPNSAVFPEANLVALQQGRPVVVIDPEDREAVERLTRIIFGPLASAAGDMAGYLREFANPKPPKPEEPTGLGAVVEDSEGQTWVRTHNHWRREDLAAIAWADLNAVRVLSEGVPS